jgi:protein farnesyltransferase subunit beta
MGRTHKLVDGCYSWWQGGIFPLVARAEEALNAQRAERIEVAKQRREQAQRGQNANAAPPATPGGAVAPLDPDWAVAVFPCARVLGGATAAAATIVELDGDEDADEQAVHSTVPTLHNPNALQGWLLAACQADGGGLRDKPGKGRDFYHSCYCLSGLSAAQHHGGIGGAKVVVGSADNLLEETHPLFNVVTRQVEASERYFSARPLQLP